MRAGYTDPLRCGIKNGSPMSVSHFLELILYTDHSKLCTLLSGSLRRSSPGEPMSAVKRRNAAYYHLSKTLRESVAVFGENRLDGKEELGPFFCGMSCVLAVPAFAIRLFAPTSTSTSLEVATRFANDGGCVFGLSNEYWAGGYRLNVFDVSWLSRYREEQERIWMGGEKPIQIASVRVLSDGVWNNYRKHFAALFWFDAVCNGSDLRGMRKALTAKNISLLSALLSGDGAKQPKYVRDCFELCRLSKTAMVINMTEIEYRCSSDLRSLFFDEWAGGKKDKETTAYSDIDGRSNLVNESVLRLFPNLQQLTVETTDGEGCKSFQSSLRGWFELFSALSLKKCTLNGVWKDKEKKDGERRSWLYYVYHTVQSLGSEHVTAELLQTKDSEGDRVDSLVFCRV